MDRAVGATGGSSKETKLARDESPFTPTSVKTLRWLASIVAPAVMVAGLAAQGADIYLPRPGSVVAATVIGEVKVTTGNQSRPVKADERVRVGATITTGRKSLAVFLLSNGATLEMGSESEMWDPLESTCRHASLSIL